ncbi:MAG: GldG family protein [Polyangiaceae bacterium]|jgi:hypothetical protein|nr:GldG family protein [Polyangiaceae bacterium]
MEPALPSSGITRSTKVISAVGVIAALVIAVLVNILSGRNYRRWDVTAARLYTLSEATVTTLRNLEQDVQVEVLLSSSDPLHGSVINLLEAYGGHTSRLDVRRIDPDRDQAEFAAVQQKYGIVAGRTEGGRVVADAALIVASRGKHWFITAGEMVDFSDVQEGQTKSKLEQVLTGGIRSVLGGERMRLCFSEGHSEFSLDDNSDQGLGELRDRLLKNNYDPISVDTTKQDPAAALDGCEALIVVGPGVAFKQPEAEAIVARMRKGMGGFFLLNPMLDTDKRTQLDTGLGSVARAFGIGIANDYVFEQDDAFRLPKGTGEVFFPELKPHATTDALLGPAAAVTAFRVVLMRSRSFDTPGGSAQPTAVLTTSDDAFGMMDFFSWVDLGGEPSKQPRDRSGPLTVGVASELPASQDGTRGARLVVLGSANPCFSHNWRDPSLRGNALFVGNAISWIAERPPIVDVPVRITPAATLRITEQSLSEVMRYVLLFMPAAAALLGLAVYLRRRSRDDKAADARKGRDSTDNAGRRRRSASASSQPPPSKEP